MNKTTNTDFRSVGGGCSHTRQRSRPLFPPLLLFLIGIGLSSLLPSSTACPFYIKTSLTTTQNFTKLGPALEAAMYTQLILWICDQSVVGVNDTLPVINQSVTVMGNQPRGQVFSYMTIENPRILSVFVLNVTDGPNPVVFENINIVGTNTLFLINGTSQLVLSGVRCYFAIVCVELNPSLPVVATRPSLLVAQSRFEGVDVAILHRNGYFICEDSTFYVVLDVAILTFNSDTNNPYATYMSLYNNNFINVLYPLAYENLQLAHPYFEPPRLSDTYMDATAYANCQTYTPVSTKNVPTSFGVAPACVSNCTKCEECDAGSLFIKILDTIAFVLFLIFLYIVVVSCFRYVSKNKTTTSTTPVSAGKNKQNK